MMRSSLITLAEEMADAVASPRWSPLLKLQLLGEAHWREWRDILNVSPHYRMMSVDLTTDAAGRFPLASLNQGTGNSRLYHYRVLSVRAGQEFYQRSVYESDPRPGDHPAKPQTWYRFGTEVQVVPARVTDLSVVVNTMPERADRLAQDTDTVDFPDSYDLVLAYEVAATMLMKGAAESDSTMAVKMQAQVLRERMHQDLARIHSGPRLMSYTDTAAQWGGV